MSNQHPEQLARDKIDSALQRSGWVIQSKNQINLNAGVFKKQARPIKYTTEQVQWLRMIKDYIANSFHVDKDDFELDPFNKAGGLGKFYQLFRDDYEKILEELNEELVA